MHANYFESVAAHFSESAHWADSGSIPLCTDRNKARDCCHLSAEQIISTDVVKYLSSTNFQKHAGPAKSKRTICIQ